MKPIDPSLTGRRQFLARSGLGVGSVALAWLLQQDRLLGEPAKPDLQPRRFDLKAKPPHKPARAKAMISLFMQGGPSHLDLFDPKPGMARWDGKNFPGSIKYDNAAQASAKVLHTRGNSPRGDAAAPSFLNCCRTWQA